MKYLLMLITAMILSSCTSEGPLWELEGGTLNPFNHIENIKYANYK